VYKRQVLVVSVMMFSVIEPAFAERTWGEVGEDTAAGATLGAIIGGVCGFVIGGPAGAWALGMFGAGGWGLIGATQGKEGLKKNAQEAVDRTVEGVVEGVSLELGGRIVDYYSDSSTNKNK